MKTFANHNSARGQTSIEYLLLLGVVAVVVITALGPVALIGKVRNTAGGYYNTVTTVIMGNGNETLEGKKINPINGGWCPVTCPTGFGPQAIYGSCECPAPALGGAPCTPGAVSCGAGQSCSGQIVQCTGGAGPGGSCGACPTGQVCLPPDGHCGCADGLVCPANSNPDPTCTQCQCDLGFYWNGSACALCQVSGGGQCTTTSSDGQSCTPLTGPGGGGCAVNMWCDTNPTDPGYNSCQCDQYTYWNGSGCVYCTATSGGQCQLPNAQGTGCAPITCNANMYCNVSVNACQCIAGYGYTTGPGCVPDSCGTVPGNATACSGTPAPTSPNQAYTLVGICDTSSPCEATCNANYYAQGGLCQYIWSSGQAPQFVVATIPSGNSTNNQSFQACGSAPITSATATPTSGCGNPGTPGTSCQISASS